MGLGGADLNLLLPLKVLLEEGNVTRAGHRLELSQPAMSSTLARLRRRFDDELLVRTGREYELTPFARELLPEVQQAVRLLASALDVEEVFEPLVSSREFRLAMSDYAVAVLHGPLVRMLELQAPSVRLVIERLGPETQAPERLLHDVDAVVAPLGLQLPGLSRPLWRDRLVLIADRDNPRLDAGTLQLQDLAELPYAAASFGPGVVTVDDRALVEAGVERDVVLRVFGYLPLPFVVAGTDMVAFVPELLARLHTGDSGRLVLVEPPVGDLRGVPLVEGYWFAPDRRHDPAHRWLFDRLDAVGRQVNIEGRAPVIQPTT